MNGHVITENLRLSPEFSKKFCPDCGAETINVCPECKTPIQGAYINSVVVGLPAPNNCHECGVAFPWRQAAIANAIEVAQAEVDGAQAEEVAHLVRSIAAASPRAEADAIKLGKILKAAGSAGGEILRKAFTDIASEMLLKAMGIR
jgi:hypothetical protein